MFMSCFLTKYMSSEGRPYNDKPHMLHTFFFQIENANEISLIVIYVINLRIIFQLHQLKS